MAENVHERLDSWKAIAEYLDHDPTTVMRWAKERGLPVYVVPARPTVTGRCTPTKGRLTRGCVDWPITALRPCKMSGTTGWRTQKRLMLKR